MTTGGSARLRDMGAARVLDADRLEAEPPGREHQPERLARRGRAARPRRYRGERAACGGVCRWRRCRQDAEPTADGPRQGHGAGGVAPECAAGPQPYPVTTLPGIVWFMRRSAPRARVWLCAGMAPRARGHRPLTRPPAPWGPGVLGCWGVGAGWPGRRSPWRRARHLRPRDPVAHHRRQGTELTGVFISEGPAINPGDRRGHRRLGARQRPRWRGWWRPARQRQGWPGGPMVLRRVRAGARWRCHDHRAYEHHQQHGQQY
jgi:hypothetical protein